jgi:hypothetical protein
MSKKGQKRRFTVRRRDVRSAAHRGPKSDVPAVRRGATSRHPARLFAGLEGRLEFGTDSYNALFLINSSR